MPTPVRLMLSVVLLSGAFGLSASLADAQAVDPDGTANTAGSHPETVQITTPRMTVERTRLNAPLGRVWLSGEVRYDDLNLRTDQGVDQLRQRVRDEAKDVCTHITEAYPVRKASGTSCYKSAVDDGLVRANAAVRYTQDSYSP